MASSPAGSLEYSCPREQPLRAEPSTHPPPANQPASPPAGLPAAACRCPPAGAGKGSHCSRALPPSSLYLTSFCSASAKPIWNCLNPNIQPPSPPPARFLHSLKQALRWLWEEGRGRREGRAGGGRRRRERGDQPLAIAQSRHIFPINEERTWVSRPVCLRRGSGSGHQGGEEAGCSGFPSSLGRGGVCSLQSAPSTGGRSRAD